MRQRLVKTWNTKLILQKNVEWKIYCEDTFVILCTIWYYLYNFKNVKNIHGFSGLKLYMMVPNRTKRLILAKLLMMKDKRRHKTIHRSSYSEVVLGNGVLKICSKFTGERQCRSATSIKLLRNFIEIARRHGCCPVNFLHIFRTPSTKTTSEGLLLYTLIDISHSFSLRFILL